MFFLSLAMAKRGRKCHAHLGGAPMPGWHFALVPSAALQACAYRHIGINACFLHSHSVAAQRGYKLRKQAAPGPALSAAAAAGLRSFPCCTRFFPMAWAALCRKPRVLRPAPALPAAYPLHLFGAALQRLRPQQLPPLPLAAASKAMPCSGA